MNGILKFKKTIIAIAVILLTVIIGLSFYAFKGNEIVIDNDNPEFCYSLNNLNSAVDPLIYKNVSKISTYEGSFKMVNMMGLILAEDKHYEFSTQGTYTETAVRMTKEDVMTKIEVYILSNSSSDYYLKVKPEFSYSLGAPNDLVLNIDVIKMQTRVAGFGYTDKDGAFAIKMLIKIT